MQTQTPKFQEWLAAEKVARAAERELHSAMLQAVKSDSPLLAEKVLLARAKRAHAQKLFDEAMQELKKLAESVGDHRIATTGASGLGKANAQQRGSNNPSDSFQPRQSGASDTH